MYDTRFKGSFKAVPIYVYKPCSIRKQTLGSISCNTTTSCPLWLIPLNWVPLELLQDSDSSQAIAPHWSSSYLEYLSPEQDKAEQWRIVWARLWSHHSNLASRLSQQKECYLALCQELNPRTTQVKSSHEPLFRDTADIATLFAGFELVAIWEYDLALWLGAMVLRWWGKYFCKR